jgi:TonB-dependent SusC/RagA subfamily outer membrane receptor
MKVLPAILLILSLSTALPAQSTIDSLILTKEQNTKWILKLEKEIKPIQLDLIKRRILLDTNIYIRQSYPDRIKFDNEKEKGTRTEGYGRLLLVFNGRYFAHINNRTKSKSIIKLADYLTDNRIKSISIVKDTQARAIYGSRAVCGAILLTTKKKSTFKQIKAINLSED